MGWTSYAIGLGSNRPHGRHGAPQHVLVAAIDALASAGCAIVHVAPTVASRPLVPAGRRFANGAAIMRTPLEPLALLTLLKSIERQFGRRRGRRWGPRVLDLDILLWDGGRVRTRRLVVPHPGLPHRRFVLEPLATIAGDWRVPPGALRVRHLAARHGRSG